MFPFRRNKLVPARTSKLYYRYSLTSSTKEDMDQMSIILQTLCQPFEKELVFLCIGTDRSTGDAFGPLVGTTLMENQCPYPVFGTIAEPVHALNLNSVLKEIHRRFTQPAIISLDACLGEHHEIGSILLKDGPLVPGYAIHNPLPEVGIYHLKGVVNYLDPHFPASSLNHSRLDTVMNLSKITSTIILNTVKQRTTTKMTTNP